MRQPRGATRALGKGRGVRRLTCDRHPALSEPLPMRVRACSRGRGRPPGAHPEEVGAGASLLGPAEGPPARRTGLSFSLQREDV